MIPIGIIVAWHDLEATVPPGWAVCDGNNGTPNLKDKFIPGAGQLWEQGDVMGNMTHNHRLTGHPHTHNMKAGMGIAGGFGKTNVTDSSSLDGLTNFTSNEPPWHALIYIMKL